MRSATKRWIPLLALALTLAPTTSIASSHDQEAQAPAAAFEDVVAAMDEGQSEQAESTYRQHFETQADNAPHAADAIETAFATLADAQPGTAEYAHASQVAKKGILAVSYHTIEAATEQGDAGAADAYFDVLATKFTGETELPDSKQAFADVDADTLADAFATLEQEYADLIAAKVYAETEETPELLAAGEETTSAKEAGEALGYGLSLHASVEQTLGEEDAQTLRDELEGLGEHALANEEDATSAEAHEILELLAAYGLSTVPDSKLDARGAYDQALDEDRIEDAASIFEDTFADDASSYATAAHADIQAALAEARQAQGDELAVQKQILEKSLLGVAWDVGFHELAEEEVHEASAYLVILVDQFGNLEEPGAIGLHLGHIEASNAALGAHTDGLRTELAQRFVDKVHEEIEEVFINWDDAGTAREKAIEAVVYYQPVRGELAATLSQEEADHLDAELRGLYNATTDRDRDEAEHEADEAREVLSAYDNAGGDVSPMDETLQSLERTLSIITVEIDEYFEYMEQGDEEEAQVEVEESKAFISRALSTFEENREALEAADGQAAADVEANLQEIQALLEDERELDAIPGLVDETVERFTAFEQTEPQGPAVDLRLEAPEPVDGGAFLVPVRLLNVPEGGFSMQATITFDDDELSIDEVDIPAQVGAETISPGEVRFNAASIETDAADPVVAELLVTPAAADLSPQLSIDIDTLTNGQGDPLAVGNVTGTQLQLATAEGVDAQTTDPVPAGGLALIGIAAVVASLFVRRDG